MPEFHDGHIDLIRRLPVELITGRGAAWDSKQGWFEYFWVEAKPQQGLFNAEASEIVPFFKEMFQLPAGWDHIDSATIPDALVPKKTWANVSNRALFDCMMALLNAGFRRITMNHNIEYSPTDTSTDLARYRQKFNHSQKIDLGWRGDTRSFQDIQDAGGFRSMSESEHQNFAADHNMRAAWHPYSRPAVRQDIWYRRASSDNCKKTLVSITRDFKTAAVFPQLSECHIFPGIEDTSKTPESFLAGAESAKYEGLLSVVTVNAGGAIRTVRRYVDKVQIFLCVLNGMYFNTPDAQEQESNAVPFKEIGVKSVLAQDVLASITYVRVHHSTYNGAGFTALFKAAASVQPQQQSFLRHEGREYSSKQLFDAATTEYNKARQTFMAAWGEQGWTYAQKKLDPSSPGIPTVTGIIKPDGTALFP
ncbi:MAG: hypothetical protein ACLP59_04700 [Bryobacteraceae bacterium]